MRLDPRRKRRIAQPRQGEHCRAQHVAVVLDVVAAQRREGRLLCLHAPAAGFHDDADRTAWRLRCREVGADQCVIGVELPCSRIQAIAVLGDGQADDPDLRARDRVEQSGARIAGIDDLGDRADHRYGFVGAAAFHQRVEPILRQKAVRHAPVGRQQPGAGDAPVQRGRILLHQRVRVPRHVRPVEAAQAKMHDARAALRQCIVRRVDRGGQLADRIGAKRNR